MKNILIQAGNKHDYILKVFLIVFSVLTIVLIFPKEGKFKYEYQKGKRWMHPDLFAPFDFGIHKTESELNEEINYVNSTSSYYFMLDSLTISQKKNEFRTIFKKHLSQYEEDFKKKYHRDIIINETLEKNILLLGKKIIDTLYYRGIFPSNIHSFIENKTNPIIIVTGNIAKEINKNQIISVKNIAMKVARIYSRIIHSIEDKSNIDSLLVTEIITQIVTPNLNYDENRTENFRKAEIEKISLTRGLIRKGEKIISTGDVINSEKFQALESVRKEYEEQSGTIYNSNHVIWGHILLVFTGIFALFIFIFEFRKDIFAENKKIFFLLLCIFLDVLGARMTMSFNSIHLYVFPFCILPLMIRIFYDTRLAFYVHMIAVLFIGFMAPNGYEFVLIQLLTGIIAIISIRRVRNRGQIFTSALVIFAIYSISYTSIALIKEGSFSLINTDNYKWFAINAGLTLFTYPFLYIFEKSFGFLSEVTLLELCDTNNKLLRALAEKAPGTFQHSLQVANLSEEAIFQIGGNSLLVRAGALYHDIGKMLMPMYFIENQSTGFNPHIELTFEESAKLIISHVIQGIELAKKRKLPDPVIDFIRTHHGTSLVHYFYKSYLKDFPESDIDMKEFSYPGPIPYSKETAVLMMADSVEASSRSLKTATPEAIDALVENIINKQLENQQFINADITLKDITVIKKIFKKKLINIYHGRIEYPR